MSTVAGHAPARPALGVLLIIGMAIAFASMDTTIRHLGAVLPVLLLLTVGARPVQSFMDATAAQLLQPAGYVEAVLQAADGPPDLVVPDADWLRTQVAPIPRATPVVGAGGA